ncbi:MAG: hypothetical protein WB778_09115 [Thermoplasmata archaeon]
MKIEHVPWKKLEIRTYTEFESPEEFANFIAAPTPAGAAGSTSLLWAEGVLFRHVPLNPPTEAIATEQLRGNLVWDHLDFVTMPKYVPELRPASRPALLINVINVSRNSLFAEVANWTKDLAKESEK